MSTITDSIGTWYQVGTLSLTENWQLFPESVINAEVFRFTYVIDWDAWNNLAGYQSFGLIRFYYPVPTTPAIVSPASRLWPKLESELRTYKISQVLVDKNYLTRDIGAKKIPRWKPLPNSTTVMPWSLKVEYLL